MVSVNAIMRICFFNVVVIVETHLLVGHTHRVETLGSPKTKIFPFDTNNKYLFFGGD